MQPNPGVLLSWARGPGTLGQQLQLARPKAWEPDPALRSNAAKNPPAVSGPRTRPCILRHGVSPSLQHPGFDTVRADGQLRLTGGADNDEAHGTSSPLDGAQHFRKGSGLD